MMFYKETNFKETPIGKIPEDWEIIEIKKVCEFIRGTEPGSKAYNSEGTGFRFIRVSDISKQVLEGVFVEEKPEKLVFCNKGDILLALDGVPGVVAEGFEGAISSGIRIVKPKTKNIDKGFLFYILQHKIVQRIIKNYTTGTTIKHASRAIDFIKIPLPPLEEQKAIASILSTLDSAIQKIDEIIAKAERLKKGLMQELLTKGIGHKEFKDTEIGRIPKDWEVIRLGDVITYQKGRKPAILLSEKKENVLPYLTADDLRTEVFTQWAEEGSDVIKVNEDDLILIWDGFYCGDAFVGFKGILSSTMVKIEPKDPGISKHFLYYFLKTRFKILNSQIAGMYLKHVSKFVFESLKVPLPSYSEQQKIAEILSTVDQKLKLERNEKAKLEGIKKGLMDLLLTGKIRIKVN